MQLCYDSHYQGTHIESLVLMGYNFNVAAEHDDDDAGDD